MITIVSPPYHKPDVTVPGPVRVNRAPGNMSGRPTPAPVSCCVLLWRHVLPDVSRGDRHGPARHDIRHQQRPPARGHPLNPYHGCKNNASIPSNDAVTAAVNLHISVTVHSVNVRDLVAFTGRSKVGNAVQLLALNRVPFATSPGEDTPTSPEPQLTGIGVLRWPSSEGQRQ